MLQSPFCNKWPPYWKKRKSSLLYSRSYLFTQFYENSWTLLAMFDLKPQFTTQSPSCKKYFVLLIHLVLNNTKRWQTCIKPEVKLLVWVTRTVFCVGWNKLKSLYQWQEYIFLSSPTTVRADDVASCSNCKQHGHDTGHKLALSAEDSVLELASMACCPTPSPLHH